MKIVLTLISLLYFFPIKAQKVEIYFDLAANYFWLNIDKPEPWITPYNRAKLYQFESALNGYQGTYGINYKIAKKIYVGAGIQLKHTRLKGRDPNGVRFTFNYIGLCPKAEYRFSNSFSYRTGLSLDLLIHKKGINFGDVFIRETHLKLGNVSWTNELLLKFKNFGIFSRFDLGLRSLVDNDTRIDPVTLETIELIPVKVKSRLLAVGFYYSLD